MQILSVNTGSSSVKITVHRIEKQETRLVRGEVSRIGLTGGRFRMRDAVDEAWLDEEHDLADHGVAVEAAIERVLVRHPELRLDAVGHRLVHGGNRFLEPHLVSQEMFSVLEGLVPIAPDHLPQAIGAIRITQRLFPGVAQVACFDTAFHRRMPWAAQHFPLPRRLADEGIIRYGFHGLSYEYITSQLGAIAPEELYGRVVAAHLGNGASMVALQGGVSVETTMGFSPAGGLMMGTRPGDLDPGVLAYLLLERRMDPASVNAMINRRSGLLGVSGISEDMRDLLQRESASQEAAEAIALFCHQAKKHLGAMVAALGGLDTLVFAGGIGEHAAIIRRRICDGLEFLGIQLEPHHNQSHAPIISRQGSPVTVRVMPTDEDLVIARHTARMVQHVAH